MEEQIRVIPLAGFEIEQEDQVTTGFCETSGPLWQGVERNIPEAFAARQRLWVHLTVITLVDEGCEAEPFAGRVELERLIELAKEKTINIGTGF